MDAVSAAAGCVMVAVAVVVHPLASVTVTIYVPAASPDSCSCCLHWGVFHEYVYPEVPLAAVTVAPLLHYRSKGHWSEL